MEEDLKKIRNYKMTSIIFVNGRQHLLVCKWKTTSTNFVTRRPNKASDSVIQLGLGQNNEPYFQG